MAKPPVKPTTPDTETEVTLMRKVAPERFEVVTATLKGSLSGLKVLEKNVSLTVGRLTARKAIQRQAQQQAAKLGITVES